MGTRQIDGVAPTFAKKPSIRQEDDGRRLLFECRIIADPKPNVSWFHDGRLVESKGRFKMIVEKEGNGYHSVLQIEDVAIEDAGKYQVTAKNELGESNATISLNFDSDDTSSSDGAKPTFTEKPIIRQADGGNTIIFECRLIADPKPTLQWFHAGKPVKDGGRYKYVLLSDKHNHTASLEISKIASEDGGEYKVVATNEHGDGQATITLNFEESTGKPKLPGKAPRFPKKPTIRQKGDSLILECVLEASPFPEIVWYHGSKQIKDGKRHKSSKKEIGTDLYQLSLEIADPTTDDGGNYRCNAVNELGESNANIALNLQGGEPEKEGQAPTFIEKPKIIPKDGGKLIHMECRIKANPSPQVTWYQATKVVRETNRVQSKIIEGKNDEFVVRLEIKDPSKADGGAYKCHIKNEHGELNANLNLNIEGEKAPEGEAPTFVEKPKIISEDDGKRVIMECKVRAKPKPDIIWYKDGVVVKETRRFIQTVKEEKDVYTIRFELREVELKDAGLYKCNAKNEAGESNANLTLNIELAPVIKEKPRIVRKEIHKKVIIEVYVQSGAAPKCTWFKESTVIKEDSRHVVNIEKVSVGEYAVRLEIEKPSVADKGSYKLSAKNEKGEITSQAIQVDIEEEPEEKKPEEKKPEEKKKKPEEKKEEKKKPEEKKPEEKKPEEPPKKKGEKPKIVQGLKSITVEVGKSAEFSCRIESRQKTTVSWYRNKTVIKESKDYKMSFDGKNAFLKIVKTTTEISGTYSIEIVNEFGKEESSAELIVKEPPKKKEEEKQSEIFQSLSSSIENMPKSSKCMNNSACPNRMLCFENNIDRKHDIGPPQKIHSISMDKITSFASSVMQSNTDLEKLKPKRTNNYGIKDSVESQVMHDCTFQKTNIKTCSWQSEEAGAVNSLKVNEVITFPNRISENTNEKAMSSNSSQTSVMEKTFPAIIIDDLSSRDGTKNDYLTNPQLKGRRYSLSEQAVPQTPTFGRRLSINITPSTKLERCTTPVVSNPSLLFPPGSLLTVHGNVLTVEELEDMLQV